MNLFGRGRGGSLNIDSDRWADVGQLWDEQRPGNRIALHTRAITFEEVGAAMSRGIVQDTVKIED